LRPSPASVIHIQSLERLKNLELPPHRLPRLHTIKWQTSTTSTTAAMTFQQQDISSHDSKPQDERVASSHIDLQLSDTKGVQESDPVENLPSPTTQAAEKPEQWNHPRSNLFRTMAAFWSFVVMGGNDAAYGALIPYVRLYPLFLFSTRQLLCVTRNVTNVCIAARVLQSHLCSHFAYFPFTAGWIHGLCSTKQHYSPAAWTKRCCHYRTELPSYRVCCDSSASSVSRARRHLHVGWLWQWTRRCCVE